MSFIIDNCIQWNLERLKLAKTPAEERRYQENIKNLEALMENETAQPYGEGVRD